MRYIALDIESQGLEAKHDPTVPIWCVGFAEVLRSGEMSSRCVPWEAGKLLIDKYLSDPDVTFCIHNSSFDVAALRAHGCYIPAGRYHDTFIMSYVSSPSASGHSLGDWGVELGLPKLECDDWKHGLTEELMTYCARDCEVTIRVFHMLWNTIYNNDAKMRRAYLEVELPYAECVMEMERIGLYVDAPRLREFNTTLSERIEKLQIELLKLTSLVPDKMTWNDKAKRYEAVAKEYPKGYYKNKNNATQYYTTSDGVLLASDPAVVYPHCKLEPFSAKARHLCWELSKLGWKPKKFTDNKEPDTSSEVLASLDYPLSKLYTEINELEKIKNTFVEGILSRLTPRSFVRANFNQCLTVTTRLSSSNPNLMNLPADGVGIEIRKCMTAPKGYDIIVGDLDGIELRVLAYYLMKVCGDRGMMDTINTGADMHQVNADRWGMSRKNAKTAIFGIIYGQTPKGFAEKMGVSLKEAEEMVEGIFKGQPAIRTLIQRIHGAARKRKGYLYTLGGHRLYYPDICSDVKWERSRAERQSQNAVIQGTAAYINKELQLRALAATRSHKAFQMCVVHDELLLLSPKSETEALLTELNTIYQATDILCGDGWMIKVTATFHKGDNWLEAKNA